MNDDRNVRSGRGRTTNDFTDPEHKKTTSHDKYESDRYSEGDGGDSTGKHSGKTFKDRILQNPAIIGAVASALLVFLISVIGVEVVQAENIVNLLLYLLVTLGVGGATGVAVRQSVSPLNKKG